MLQQILKYTSFTSNIFPKRKFLSYCPYTMKSQALMWTLVNFAIYNVICHGTSGPQHLQIYFIPNQYQTMETLLTLKL